MAAIRNRGASLKSVATAKAAEPAPSPSEAGGLAASLELIKSGRATLKKRMLSHTPDVTLLPLVVREPSNSLASVLKRKLEARKVAMGGENDDDDDVDEWT